MIKTKNNSTTNAPIFWGIVNITEDSFSDGGLFSTPDKALKQFLLLKEKGADIIDIGAASSRPSSEFISAQEEWQRLKPLFDLLEENDNKLFSSVSVDTWRAEVAQKVLEKNVSYINDISAFSWDPSLLDVLVQYKPYYVLMHCLGTPQNMQISPNYTNVVDEVFAFFEAKLERLDKAGFPLEKVILDPGIGFGKTLEHNLALMQAGEKFLSLGQELMAAVSRKSWLRDIFSIQKASLESEIKGQRKVLDRLTSIASLSLHKKGYTHHRVHNVEIVKQAFTLESFLE